ncbi:hypothetical protein [Actinocorallia populi]|nr:hypothetical protein [Actinocorallia populi]
MRTLINRLFRRRVAAEYCESCANVCDSACRAAAVRERARSVPLTFGPRF